jgi:CRP/FNR family transcriptional regulator, cyclic AMP receptor protein
MPAMLGDQAPFAHLDEQALRGVAPGGAVRSYARNVVVVSEGDPTDSLYVVLSGRVKVFVADETGKEVVVNTIGTGDFFGELVLDGQARAASVMTLEPSRFFVIPQRDVAALLSGNPQFARDLVRKLIGRVRSLTEQVRSLALRDVYSRLVRFLEDQAVEDDGRRVVRERLTQAEIAARIGGSREMVSRILSDLSAGGYIAVETKRIVLLRKLPAHW